MTNQTCATGCGRPTREVRLLCDHHVWEVEQALAEMPALLDELQNTFTKQTRMTDGKSGDKPTKGKIRPLPYDVRASDALERIRVVLVGWVMDLYDSSGIHGPACQSCSHSSCLAIRWHVLPPDTLRGMARWLLSRLNDIARHSAADDIWEEITDAVTHGWQAVDRAATKTRFIVGPCPERSPADGASCPGEVWAYIPTSEDRKARLSCAECDTTWETHQWLRAGKRILAELGSRQAASGGDAT